MKQTQKKLPRLKFKCWNCHRNYTLMPSQMTKEQELIVPCPFCGAEAVVKLEPFKKKIIPVNKSTNDDEQAVGYEYVFPDVIPTEEPK